jgi:hypothetical protein
MKIIDVTFNTAYLAEGLTVNSITNINAKHGSYFSLVGLLIPPTHAKL